MISLDGNISDFFDAGGVALPGVCVTNDSAPAITGVPGSEGLGEPPLSDTTTADGLLHPSGFNQRRIMSAYNPGVNGGTIYIGVDLPGGSGSTANPDYTDSVIPVRGSILPFDADANGEAETIGRTSGGGDLVRCGDAGSGSVVDVLNCAATESAGFTDAATDVGVTENYVVQVIFGDFTTVEVDYREDLTSGAGNARMVLTQSGTTFGARISTSTLGVGNGAPQGRDVEFAITNVNANVDACNRLIQTIIVDSGSNRDGAGNGEDNNVLNCNYVLPATVQCEVLFFTNNVQVTGNNCPPLDSIAYGVLAGTTVEARVVVSADSGNAQDIASCELSVSGAITTNIALVGTLSPGESATNSVGSFTCPAGGVQTVTANLKCFGAITEQCVTNTTMCSESIQCCGTPCVKIDKLVTCKPADGNCTNAADYAESATGAKGDTQNPAFCYKITITNCGSVGLTISNVNDTVYGDLTSLFPATLDIGETATIYFSDSHSNTTVNTVTVGADGDGNTGHVTSQDTATANVVPASITCEVSLTSDATSSNVNAQCLVLQADGTDHVVTNTIKVTAGGVALHNVTVTNTLTAGCNAGPFSLGANQMTSIVCTVTLNCSNLVNGMVTNKVTVSGEVDSSVNDVCALDEECDPITVSHICEAVVKCEGNCITRTPGYWFTHWKSTDANCATLDKALTASGGSFDLGFICLSGSHEQVLNQALGFFWKKKTSVSDGKASQLCRARKQLAFHLIAAIANVELLGTDPSGCRDLLGNPLPGDLIEKAREAAACGDLADIHMYTDLLDQFNNSGDDADFPDPLHSCKADPKGAKAAAVDPTTIANCNSQTNNCAAGAACP
jgi:hypothetical protein